MPDITSITLAITAIKNAIDISKVIGEVDPSLEKAELKWKIVELREALITAKNELLDVKELIQEKDKRIKELEQSLENKPKLIRHEGMYFESDENGKPTGDPYCSFCWETKNKAIHMNNIGGIHKCASCKSIITD